MRGDLRAFLDFQSTRSFRWGSTDCAMFMADWVLQLDGRDPAAAWRGKYSTERGAYRLALRSGGLAAMAAATGWRRVTRPRLGDFALLAPLQSRHEAEHRFAVAGAGTWILRGPDGVVVTRRNVWSALAIWRRP